MNQALETRLARAARTPGADLASALAALEGADWALLFAGEADLLAALARLAPGATLRPDPRLPLEAAARAAGFEIASFEADWRSSLVWLPEPDERAVKRARKADAHVIADATFCPGGAHLAGGARWVTYRDAGALSGHADVAFAALLGTGEVPDAPGTLGKFAEALLLRDLPTLGARLARQTRHAQTLVERLGERAEAVSGAVFLLTGEPGALFGPGTLFEPAAPLGGVVAARRALAGGQLLSAGLESVEDLWRDLSGEAGASLEELEEDVSPAAAEPEPEPTPEPEVLLAPDLPPTPTGEPGADPAEDLSEDQRAAYERLREWRNAEARRQEVSRFIIASNATLAEIARGAPQNAEELRAVRGMGPERTRKYGEDMLNLVRGMR